MTDTEQPLDTAPAPETQAPLHVNPPQDPELLKLWQEYLQKCCEVGQLDHQLDMIESQKSQIEKNLEVTKRAAKSAAAKHRELQVKQLKKESTQGQIDSEGSAH